MDKKKIADTRVTMILNCICAIAWDILALVGLANGSPNALHIICAIAWDFCAVVWVMRYLKLMKNPSQ